MKKTVLFILFCCFLFTSIQTAYSMSDLPEGAKPYCETTYPIMLVPGVSGIDSLLGIVDYWYQIPQSLTEDGATVKCASLSAVEGTAVRGEQLIIQIEEFLAETGKSKVNLIGHSHGTTTSRYVAYFRPDLVASLSLIAGPHKGTLAADFFLQFPDFAQEILFSVANLLGEMINLLGGYDYSQDAAAMFLDFSNNGESFNALCPSTGVPVDGNREGEYSEIIDGHEIFYYSWTGQNSGITNLLDIADPILTLFGKTIETYGEYNHDGLVQVESTHFGKVLRDDFDWNHLDEVNLMFGLRKPSASNPISVIRHQVNLLQQQGL